MSVLGRLLSRLQTGLRDEQSRVSAEQGRKNTELRRGENTRKHSGNDSPNRTTPQQAPPGDLPGLSGSFKMF